MFVCIIYWFVMVVACWPNLFINYLLVLLD